MKIADNNTRHFEIALQLSKLNNAIQIKANGLVGLKNGYIPDLNALKFNWVAGVGLHIPLFDGYATHFKEQLAQANLSVAEAHRAEVQRLISTEVNQAIEDVLAQKKKLSAADLQLEQASAAVSLANKQYEAGVVTNLELLDAHTTQAQSRLLKSKALYNLALSEYKLQQAIGEKNW